MTKLDDIREIKKKIAGFNNLCVKPRRVEAWTSNIPRPLYGRRGNQIEVEFPSWLQELLLLTYFDKVSFKFEFAQILRKSWIKFQHYYGRSKGMTIGD
jgi:hypothetical protein